MYKEFCITDINLSLPNKTITLKANFKIDEKSVNSNSVLLKDSISGDEISYKVEAKGYRIIITLADYPKLNNEYTLNLSETILDKLERPLASQFSKRVMFESQVKYTVSILTPLQGETVKGKDLNMKIAITPEEDVVLKYNYQIALDTAFCEIVHETTTEEKEVVFSFDADKQYFARVRALEGESIGVWSDITDFIMVNTNDSTEDNTENDTENNDNNATAPPEDNENNQDKEDSEENVEEDTVNKEDKNELSPFLEDMLSMDVVLMDTKPLKLEKISPNGQTSANLLLYFNQEIEEFSEYIFTLRRDL